MTERFEQLADRYLHQELTDAEAGELATLLEQNESLATRLRVNLVTDGLLCEAVQSTKYKQVFPVQTLKNWFEKYSRVTLISILTGTALLLFVGFGLFLYYGYYIINVCIDPALDQRITVQSTNSSVSYDSVACITGLDGVLWKENSPSYSVGELVSPGWLRIQEGTVCLQFFCGANVILKGPTDFMVVSRDLAWCSRGKIMANVPPQAIGFTINVPQMTVIDRGTEFTLDVTPSQSEVQVLKGEVDLDQLPCGRTRLEAGSGMAVDTWGKCLPINISTTPERSVADLINDNVASETQERIDRWQRAVAKISADPATLLRFDMTPLPDSFRTISNLATGAAQRPTDGVRVGCPTGIGFLSCNTSLEFRRISDRVRILVPNELHCFTLFTRVRLDTLSRDGNCLLMTDGIRARGIGWRIMKNHSIRLDIYDDKSGSTFHYDARLTNFNKQLGRWLTLACVIDTKEKTVCHYVNGKLMGKKPMEHSFPVQIGTAELGNWNCPAGTEAGIHCLHGAMDEFIISTRAWSSEEMQY